MTMPSPEPRPRPPAWPAAVLVALFAAGAIPLIIAGGLPGRPGWDHYNFHEPTIRAIARTWPRADVANYLTATTPLYHWLLGGVARHMSGARWALQLAGAAFTAGLLALLARACTRALPRRPALALVACLPFAASLYVFPSGVWLLPDNAAWLGVLGIWLLVLHPGWSASRTAAAAGLLLLLVLTRQIHLWAAALIWLAAWLGGSDGEPAGTRQPFLPFADLLRPRPERLRRLGLALLLTLPAFAAVGAFAWTWGGLVPPRFRGLHEGAAPAAPALGLTLLGVYSAFFAPWLAPGLPDTLRRNRAAIVGALVAGLLLGAIPVSAYSTEAGRFGGLWNLAARDGFVIADRFIVLVIGAPLGACALVLWLADLPARRRVIMLGAFVAFEAAQTANPTPWQRYQEPMLLMFVALAAVQTPAAVNRGASAAWGRAAMVAGPILLALLFAALTAASLANAPDASTVPRDPAASPDYRGPPQPLPPAYTEEPLRKHPAP